MNDDTIIGQRFGLMVVSEFVPSPRPSSKGRHVALICDCGGTKIMAVRRLNAKSKGWDHCGCLTNDRLRRRRVEKTKTGYRTKRVDGVNYQEHVWVMMQEIKRPLLPSETVHHMNGEKDDNRPDNLELWDSNHPSGQRVKDKVAWCREYLAEYGHLFPK